MRWIHVEQTGFVLVTDPFNKKQPLRCHTLINQPTHICHWHSSEPYARRFISASPWMEQELTWGVPIAPSIISGRDVEHP